MVAPITFHTTVVREPMSFLTVKRIDCKFIPVYFLHCCPATSSWFYLPMSGSSIIQSRVLTFMVSPSFLMRSLPSLVQGAGSSSSLFSKYLHTRKPDFPFSGQYFTT